MDATLSARAHKRRITTPQAHAPGHRFRQQSSLSLKNGDLFISELGLTREVAPGGVVDMKFTVSNGGLIICPTFVEPDCCGLECDPTTGGVCSVLNGYLYQVSINPSWESNPTVTDTNCIGTTEDGTVDHEFVPEDGFTWQAPFTTGTFEIDITLEGARSGQSATTTVTISVDEDADDNPGIPPCSRDSDCPSGFECQDGECVSQPSNGGGGGGGGGNDPLDTITRLLNNLPLILVLIIIILALNAATG